MKTTTLNRIRAHSPCHDRWEKLLKGLGKTKADDEPIPYVTILEICGISDALWAALAEPQYNWRLLAVTYACRVQHLNRDPRVSRCLVVAERYAHGQATEKELAAAWYKAKAAESDATNDAARDAARAAAMAVAGAAAMAAMGSAWAAWDAARAAEIKEQEKLFLEFVGNTRGE